MATNIFNSDGVGPGIGVTSIEGDEVRTGTKSGYDLAYWAAKFATDGTPSDYNIAGPETDGISLVAWACDKIGVYFPGTYDQAVAYIASSKVSVDVALRTRGALLVTSNRIAISAGLDNIIDVVNGRHFLYKSIVTDGIPTTSRSTWEYGALIPGVIYK